MGSIGNPIVRILFCGHHFPAFHTSTIDHLQNHPSTPVKVDVVAIDDVPDVIGNYDILVVKDFRVNAHLISRANQMKLIMQFGVGLEGVDISAATKKGIKVARIPSDGTGNATSCAEMAVFLILALLRNQTLISSGSRAQRVSACLVRKFEEDGVHSNFQHEMRISVRDRRLGEPVGETLQGKMVFIMGLGNIGIQLAKRLMPFGVKILATKRSWPLMQNSSQYSFVHEKGSHQDILKFASRADIVVCCLNLNTQTAGIVDHGFISSMRKGALLVNIARGGLLDYNAVLHHLKSGHLGGLGTDVAWTEPIDPDDAILKFSNVVLTPHVAGVTEVSCRFMAKVVGDVALQLYDGEPFTGIEIVN